MRNAINLQIPFESNSRNQNQNINNSNKDNLNHLPNFFLSDKYEMFKPYDFKSAINRIESLTDEEFSKNNFKQQELDLDFHKDENKLDLENVKILTMKKYKDPITSEIAFKFIELHDLNNLKNTEGSQPKLLINKNLRSKEKTKQYFTTISKSRFVFPLL